MTANLANYWATKDWDVTVLTLALPGTDCYDLDSRIRRVGLGMVANRGGLFRGVRFNMDRLFALGKMLQKLEPKFVIAMMPEANVLLALASWGLKNTRTIGSERVYPPQSPPSAPWRILRRLTYKRLSAVTGQTAKSCEWLQGHTSAGLVRAIPNPVVWPLSARGPYKDPTDLCPPGRRVLLSVGRSCEQKQFPLLIEVFRLMSNSHPEWDLVIIGDGPRRSTLQEQVRAAQLGHRIFLPGHVGNVEDWYKRSQLFVLPSKFEGFPNALIEAMAHGVPAVSFDCQTGPSDIIRHGVDGLLVPAGSVDGLRDALDRLMRDFELRRQFAGRAVEVRDRFSIARIARMWEDLFEELR